MNINQSGVTYVAYLFAHNAGGFGPTETDNVISCGSFTTDGSGNATVNLGYEVQWLLTKTTAVNDNWTIEDNMRGMNPSNTGLLFANLANAETSGNPWAPDEPFIDFPTATGFRAKRSSNTTYIYIAIRRGPMKTPTTGESVLQLGLWTGNDTNPQPTSLSQTLRFTADLAVIKTLSTENGALWADRLRGGNYLLSSNTNSGTAMTFDWGRASSYATVNVGAPLNISARGQNVSYVFSRAPRFFDEVCYTTIQTPGELVNHNLGVVPELIIQKSRNNGVFNWYVGTAAVGLYLNTVGGNNGFPFEASGSSATQFRPIANASGIQWVFYLFASCPGVSKVGSYTGNGTTQAIACGFTGGARFVLIKRTDSTGDWYVWDSQRGIVTANDPHISLNTTAVEVTTNDSIDPVSSGFIVNQLAATNINVNAATYIFLAIA
jgi:hypothetical protein